MSLKKWVTFSRIEHVKVLMKIKTKGGISMLAKELQEISVCCVGRLET